MILVVETFSTPTDGMRRPVSGRDAVGSQVINALEAQEIKETGNEKESHFGDSEQEEFQSEADGRFGPG
jgi:hypothetical protein